jgi:hypothetical protein
MRLVDGRVGIGVPAPARILDVADRIRVRQGPSGGAGISLYQNGPGTERASLVMTSDNVVSLMGSANWGLNMDVTNGHVGVRASPVGPPWVLYVVGDSLVSGRLRDGKLRMHAVAANKVEISSTIDKPAWSPVPNMSLTVAGPSIGAWFLIRFNMNGLEHGGVAHAHAEFRLLIDGGQHDYTLHQFHGDGWQRRGVCLERMIWLGPGAHPVVVQWSVRSPEARPEGPLDPVPVVVTLAGCSSGDYRFLSAIEL